jgi:hypothetical protein
MSTRYALDAAEKVGGMIAAERSELALHAPEMPTIGPHGLLTYRGRSVCLSERNALLAGVFIYRFNSELTDLELLDRMWPEGATHWTVRLCLRRLDRRVGRVGRVGLEIVEVGEHAHAMRSVDDR